MSRELLDECVSGSAILKSTSSFACKLGTFQQGKPKNLDSREKVRYCLSKTVFQVIQFDKDGNKIADTDAAALELKNKPVSLRKLAKKSNDWEVAELQDPARDKAHAEARQRAIEVEKKWLEEEKKAKEKRGEEEGDIHADVFSESWTPAMSRKRLAEILEQRGGQPDGLDKGKIIKALEALDAAAETVDD